MGKALGFEDGSIGIVGNGVGEKKGVDDGGLVAPGATVGLLLNNGSLGIVEDAVGDTDTGQMDGERVAGLRDGADDALVGSGVGITDGCTAADVVGEVVGLSVGDDEGKSAVGLADTESGARDEVRDGALVVDDNDGVSVDGASVPGRRRL